MISLFLLMYSARFILMSFFRPSILFSIKLPRCLAPSTHGSGFPQRSRGFTNLSFLRNFRHFVLHLAGFLSVLNLRLCTLAYSSHTLSILCRELLDGAIRRLSSLYPRIPIYSPLIQHPDFISRSCLKRSLQ